ncbi:MAG TPA: L-glutamate gamma-semialdehyde dehydrogenase [candidate division WOR-3 bacterium]|uniref:L-glutamate gamma-semialdehyde dehydrogenase n=1 Tax=candidate division WOR-3 bacterium TaxID=2052148 RepID=A0A9C9K0F2_UNCW3|nr:L-glutamate gamma-semialdehyde dehydrogenase [candidate division WOR-3 bacterium]
MKPFRNEKYNDFTKPSIRKKMEKAIKEVEAQFGKEYSIIIGGERIRLDNKFHSYNPSKKGEIVGTFQEADISTAEKAMEVALETFKSWRFTPAKIRANYLLKIAKIMRKRRLELAAWMVFESGKNWLEADADVAEAIDFCEYYAREALRYDKGAKVIQYPGERNEQIYIPLGVGLVLAPWNFPLAILCGMTTASFAAGNTVIMKPSEDSPTIAAKFMEIIEEAKVPVGVVNFMTGHGKPAADHLVKHPKTRFICFTGSKAVGLYIVEQAGKTRPGQKWIKRVIAEMGGKDLIIVDSEADIDSAVAGVRTSAFGFQGQKCSACSRLILDDKIYDKFMKKFIPTVEAIKIGPVKDYENWLGPVINETAYNSILEYIKIGKSEGNCICGGEPAPGDGWFIKPTVIVDIEPQHRIFQEEIFGPVLAVTRARNFEHAIELANDTEYGLTGAVYTKNRKKIEKAKREVHVGNLYFNRKCTGALVGVQPFGGFNMSGTDSKAGGPDYLLLFTQAKSICEYIGKKKRKGSKKKKSKKRKK